MIILDTNVVSELLRAAPGPMVEAWLAAQDAADVYFTAVSEAELLTAWPSCRRDGGGMRSPKWSTEF